MATMVLNLSYLFSAAQTRFIHAVSTGPGGEYINTPEKGQGNNPNMRVTVHIYMYNGVNICRGVCVEC